MKSIRAHWWFSHFKDTDRAPIRFKGKCPVCCFDENSRNNKKTLSLREHFEKRHDAITLMEAGVDVFKIRRSCLSKHARVKIANWFLKKGMIQIEGGMLPIPVAPVDEPDDDMAMNAEKDRRDIASKHEAIRRRDRERKRSAATARIVSEWRR